jgi:putative membrane protein
MKRTGLHILLVAGLLSVTACNDTQKNGAKDAADSLAAKADTLGNNIKEGAEKMADKVDNAFHGTPDSNFVVKASLDNAKDIRLLQAGWDNGTDKELKAHAKMMIADHKKLATNLKGYATKKGYVLPDSDMGKADDELATLSRKTKGKDWDKEWTDALRKSHKDAIDMFEDSQNGVKDQELRDMITATLPTLRSHLEMMKGLQDKLEK